MTIHFWSPGKIRKNCAATTLAVACLLASSRGAAQGMAQGAPPPPNAKPIECKDRQIPQLEYITQRAGIHFLHLTDPEGRYILEPMSGSLLLLHYDRDGWLDIYLTNAPTVEGALKGEKAQSTISK